DVTGFFPNPPLANEAYTWLVNASVFEGLTSRDPDHRIEPALAVRWENPDERTYVFELRQGLRFADGRPVRARDVAASLLAPARHGWPNRDYLHSIESVEPHGDRILRVKTRAPDLVLLTKLPWGYVLPEDALSAKPVPSIGTGPYRVESWSRGRAFLLARNPHYRGPAAPFAEALFLVEPDGRKRVALVTSGHADLADHVPFEVLDELRSDPDLLTVERPGLTVMFLALRVDRPPFDDARVREAVDLALDREALVAAALGGHGQVAVQLVPAAVAGFDPTIRGGVRDLARARRLLAEAGHTDGIDVALDGTHNRYPRDRELLAAVAAQLAEAGIRVKQNPLDKRDFFQLVDAGRSSFHLLGFACEAGDAGDALDQLAYSPGDRLGAINSAGLRDAELDRLIDAANNSTSPFHRLQNLRRALGRLATLHAYVPLVLPNDAVVVGARVAWEPPLDLGLRPADMRPAPP
ncbi:MAG TPA: ABC transporter substrate-binding protein, partial [Vicinamibacteria bacterium]|nr:ABC transporter substrate-binding protein [Vicinamibacteria bacterium]